MGVQEVSPLTKTQLMVRGILGIVKSVGAGSNMWGAESSPTNQEPI